MTESSQRTGNSIFSSDSSVDPFNLGLSRHPVAPIINNIVINNFNGPHISNDPSNGAVTH